MNNQFIFQIISRCFDYGYTIGITDFSLANNLAAIVNCMQTLDATKEASDLTNLENLVNQDMGDYYRSIFSNSCAITSATSLPYFISAIFSA